MIDSSDFPRRFYSETNENHEFKQLELMLRNSTELFNNFAVNSSTNDTCDIACNDKEHLIWTYVPPFLLVLGTVGGILTILVLTRKNQRGNSSAIYLLALAVSDMFVLYSGLLRQWLRYIIDVDIRDLNSFLCKTNSFSVYFSLDVSSWILVALTLERLVLIWFPHKSKRYCTQKTAIVVIVALCICSFLLNIHIVFGFIIQNDTSSSYLCTYVSEDYVAFFTGPWPWIDLLMFCVLPTVVLLIGNVLIMIKLGMLRRKRRSMTKRSSTTNNQGGRKPSHNSWKVTVAVLVLLDLWFFVCTAPISIILVASSTWILSPNLHQPWAVSNMFMYANNTFNFVLYCLSGSKFRKEVKDMFQRNPRSSNRKIANKDIYTTDRQGHGGNDLVTYESDVP